MGTNRRPIQLAASAGRKGRSDGGAGGGGARFFGEASDEGLWVGNVDMTITDEEFEELENLLGGGST